MNSRYRLQQKEAFSMPNVLGNHSMPVKTYRWKDIAVCGAREPLEHQMLCCSPSENYRIIDTEATP